MKTKSKVLLGLGMLLAIIMAFAVFAFTGCGGDDNPDDNPSNTDNPTDPSTDTSGTTVTELTSWEGDEANIAGFNQIPEVVFYSDGSGVLNFYSDGVLGLTFEYTWTVSNNELSIAFSPDWADLTADQQSKSQNMQTMSDADPDCTYFDNTQTVVTVLNQGAKVTIKAYCKYYGYRALDMNLVFQDEDVDVAALGIDGSKITATDAADEEEEEDDTEDQTENEEESEGDDADGGDDNSENTEE